MITIRPAVESDTPRIARVYQDCMNTAEWMAEVRPELMDYERVTAGEMVFVAVDPSGGIVGFLSIWRPECFVHHLYVSESMRRQGVGKALLASLDSWLPRPWTLKCSFENVSALKFYQSLGWMIMSEGENEDGRYYLMTFK
ncbi:GNAT family N-acetyltransferase [Rhodopirellula sp. SWK7]|uniref:GNAT family N-acetyltransferase n=1 Tax=Rhodopirellula sp. SWK7 TaxID=595460 RepID=UPI0005C44721|nr:GNAT family N-acetyltransferase [Rhodopirellula sp. SWK7]